MKRWLARRRLKAMFITQRWVPEQQMITDWHFDGTHVLIQDFAPGHWRLHCSADELACAFYTHFEAYPEDFAWAQPWIKRAFLCHFPGREGDAFRSLVWPPPLYREMHS